MRSFSRRASVPTSKRTSNLLEGLEPRRLLAAAPFETDRPLIDVNGHTLFDVQTQTSHTLYSFDGSDAVPLLPLDNSTFLGSVVGKVGNTAYFTREDFNTSFGDWILWRTDGTVAGTAAIANLGTSSSSSELVQSMGAAGSNLYLGLARGQRDGELWVSDGTAVGTSFLHTFSGYASGPYAFTAAGNGNRVYFAADSSDAGGFAGPQSQQIWRSDGTFQGTIPISTINGPDTPGSFGTPDQTLQAFNGEAVWAAGAAVGTPTSALTHNNGNGVQTGDKFVLASNGTDPVDDVTIIKSTSTGLYFVGQFLAQSQPAGLYVMTDLSAAPARVQSVSNSVGQVHQIGDANGKFVYTYGGKLYAANGTTRTQLTTSTIGNVTAVANDGNGKLYFIDSNAALWSTDGTSGGTHKLITVAFDQFGPTVLGRSNGGAFFTTADGTLYVTDGTAAGTRALPPVTQQPGRIAGLVFDDRNGNGTRQASKENGLKGYRVYVDLNADGVWQQDSEPSTTCSRTGRYTLTGLQPGKYWIQVLDYSLVGRRASTPDRFRVTVQPSTTITRYFGLTKRALISGTVYNDVNQNGFKDTGDTGVAGVAVYLDIDGDGFPAVGDPHVITDGAGHWQFALSADTYRIGVYPTNGYFQTTPVNFYHTITVQPAQIVSNLKFGLVSTNSFNFGSGSTSSGGFIF